MDKRDLLIELGCEEIPSRFLQSLSKSLADTASHELANASLAFEKIKPYATPRRLAILVEDLDAHQPAAMTERLGPAVKDAYGKDGSPTLACICFAKSCGISVDQLLTKETKKGERVFAKVRSPAIETKTILPDLIEKIFKRMVQPKPMRWGTHDYRFVRPVHWATVIYGNELIATEIFGCKTKHETMGHRFHHPSELQITTPRDYNVALYSKGYVIADFKQRQQVILKQLEKCTASNQRVIAEQDLLDEVTGLVEWPIVLKGKFNPDFLSVPKEVLITSMQSHQKCFAIEDDDGKLAPAFVLVCNIESRNSKAVIHGNECVIQARLSDAKFFYENDLKTTLEERASQLHNTLFQKQLGTLAEKTERIALIAQWIAKEIKADKKTVTRTATLLKSDLVSEMVYEFPELQGVMGYYYALNDGETRACATAIKEHYYPRFSGDDLPSTAEGCALAIADRVDTLIGILGINKMPTGDKDPFALRRATLGMLRILIEKELDIDLMDLFQQAKAAYGDKLANDQVVEHALEFTLQRLKYWYGEQAISAETFEAVAASHSTTPLDFNHRIQAVQQFLQLPEAQALAAANKRVSNILKKQDNVNLPEQLNEKLFEHDAERTLAEQIHKQEKAVAKLYKQAKYTESLSELAILKDPVDNFFDKVMVLDEDEEKRHNRLALLTHLRTLFSQVADISLLSTNH